MMNHEKILEGLGQTIQGLMLVCAAIKEADYVDSGKVIVHADGSITPASADEPGAVTGHLATSSEIVATDSDKSEKSGDKFDRAQLDAMPYNEFKKLAARLGVKCTGTRDQITERVLALNPSTDGDITPVNDPDETKGDTKVDAETEKPAKKLGRKSKDAAPVEEPETPPKSQPKGDKLSGGKRGLKKAAPVPAEDEFDLKAKEVADNTSVEDILAALNEVGVKANAKNFLPKLADALRQNLLSIDEDDDDETDEGSETDDVDDTADDETTEDAPSAGQTSETYDGEIEADSYFSQYDPEGFNDPANMSEERQEAVVTKMDEILTEVSENELTPDLIQTYLEENATQDELDLLGDEPTEDDMLMLYMELQKRLIDNDGDIHESSDPYELGENDMCCGHKLKYVAKTKKYVCEMCGTEYEAE